MDADARLIADFYDANAASLAAQYLALDPASVHPELAPLLPSVPSHVLDAGAGSGRDAAWLASLGHRVTAAEPSKGMRDAAVRHASVTWSDAALPALEGLEVPDGGFSFALVSAVWMHLPPTARRQAWRTLASVLRKGSFAAVTLRHGPGDPLRTMHALDAGEEIAWALSAGFTSVTAPRSACADKLGRSGVSWQTIAARL